MRLPKQTLSLTLLPPATLWAEEKRCLSLAPAQRRRSQSRRLTRLLRLTRHARLYISETLTLTLTLTLSRHARLYIFETYCRIHERIDLKMLAKKLGMEQIAAEKWIVKMVSSTPEPEPETETETEPKP